MVLQGLPSARQHYAICVTTCVPCTEPCACMAGGAPRGDHFLKLTAPIVTLFSYSYSLHPYL